MSDRKRNWTCVGLSIFSGALFPLATADFDIWPLAWVGMLPCVWAVAQATPPNRNSTIDSLPMLEGQNTNDGSSKTAIA